MNERITRSLLMIMMIFVAGYLFGRATVACAEEAWTVAPVVDLLSHDSDIRRGYPFNHDEEPEANAIQAGVVFGTPSRKIEIELLHGWRCIECRPRDGRPETNTRLTIRYRPLGERAWRIGKKR